MRWGHLFGIIVGRNADRHHVFVIGVKETELVEMAVQPTHRVLDRHMEVPERVGLGNAIGTLTLLSCVSPRHENPFVREFEQPQ